MPQSLIRLRICRRLTVSRGTSEAEEYWGASIGGLYILRMRITRDLPATYCASGGPVTSVVRCSFRCGCTVHRVRRAKKKESSSNSVIIEPWRAFPTLGFLRNVALSSASCSEAMPARCPPTRPTCKFFIPFFDYLRPDPSYLVRHIL